MNMAGKKILIIEDDPDSRMGVDIRLRKHGYDTAFAGDAVTALSVMQREKHDLVLLDLGLPADDGFALLDRVKKTAALSATPVIVLSARDPVPNRELALKAGAVAYFQKPADNEELMETIRKILMG